MIEVSNLSKHYSSTVAVDDITFSIEKGEICGYLGPNGAGKTTTVRMLTGMLKPTSGTASIDGISVIENPLEIKKLIGYVPESGALFETLTPREYLTLVGRLHQLEDSLIQQRAKDLTDFWGMSKNLDQQMTSFSKGMRQKIVITSAIIHNPKVIFLDEPLNGLDANATLLLKELIRNLAKKGKTIFYCSHILDVVEKMCDAVIIIERGVMVAHGSVDELKEMTMKTTLEDVFSKLTKTDDVETKAKDILSKIM
jgi:ABC-2 type transport system ATP-binding protein